MGKLKSPLVLGPLIGAGVLLLMGQIAAAVVCIFLAVLATALLQTFAKQKARSAEIEQQLSHDSRTRLRPIKRLHSEIEELVKRNSDSTAIKVIGKEALEESAEIVEKCARLLKLRREIEKGLQGEFAAERDAAELELELSTAGPIERESLSSALEARKLEGSHYDRMQQSLLEIDLDVKKAEAALSELRARLAVSATVSPEVGGQNELDEVVSRLKSLSVSFDEAEEMLKEQVS